MPWLQLAVLIDRDQAAAMEAALESFGALAVSIDDGADDPSADPLLEPGPGQTPLWRRLRLTALFEDDPSGAMQAQEAATAVAAEALAPPLLTRLEDRPWERVWLEDFAPRRFGERLWICPRGLSVDDPHAVVVDLDPGLAFGTGHHPTTALCLRWLDGAPLAGRRLLDFGCGSGILAIAALKLGAAQAIAVDHDPQALEATAENAEINGVAERLLVLSPERLARLPAREAVADVVIANILAGPLIELAPTLTRHVAPSGLLALSGLLAPQAAAVAAAYERQFLMEPAELEEDWALLYGRRLQDGAHAP